MVKILLSVHNGEKYLDELLDSIEAQEYANWLLVIADDGSSDGTNEILRRRIDRNARMSVAVRRPEAIGPAASFMQLLTHVDDGELFAFCDQDDVWFAHKLAWTVDAVVRLVNERSVANQAEEGGAIVAVCTDAIVTDESLHPVDSSALRAHGVAREVTLGRLLVNNVAIGATLVGTSGLAAAACRLSDTSGEQFEVRMHDWWCALIAAYAGTLLVMPAPTMWWRRHTNTVTGGQPASTSGRVGRRLRSLSWSREAATILNANLTAVSADADTAAAALVGTPTDNLSVGDLVRLHRRGVRAWSVANSVKLASAALVSRRKTSV